MIRILGKKFDVIRFDVNPFTVHITVSTFTIEPVHTYFNFGIFIGVGGGRPDVDVGIRLVGFTASRCIAAPLKKEIEAALSDCDYISVDRMNVGTFWCAFVLDDVRLTEAGVRIVFDRHIVVVRGWGRDLELLQGFMLVAVLGVATA